jgi:hypothetical protein
MTFGGSNCPATWCSISELMADTTNALLSSLDWDSNELKWDHQHLVPPPDPITTSQEIANYEDTLILPDPRPWGTSDVFIDDIIVVMLNRPDYIRNAAAATPLAIDILSRPFNEDDKPPREHMIAISKLKAEGSLREAQIILGWKVDTRKLEISLPELKYRAWLEDINKMLEKKATKFAELESLIGRLVHCSMVLPLARFYLGDLRRHLSKRKSKRRRIKLGEN